MAQTRTAVVSVGGANVALKNARDIAAEGIVELEVTVPISATDLEVGLVLDVSQITMFWMYADGDLTIETNADDAAGGQTITYKANKNYYWEKESGITNPLTIDITKIFVTNAVATARTLRIVAMFDATP